MKLQIIPFDVAKDLKELGFDLECEDFLFDGQSLKSFLGENNNWNKFEDYVSLPSQALVVKWLRDVHGICIVCTYIATLDVWEAMFVVKKFMVYHHVKGNIGNYEEAELEGIKAAIKYLKQ